jgi:ribosomal protein L12E/L44/L45/RPP1/RPP2
MPSGEQAFNEVVRQLQNPDMQEQLEALYNWQQTKASNAAAAATMSVSSAPTKVPKKAKKKNQDENRL